MQRWEYMWKRIWWKGGLFSGHYELKFGDNTLEDNEIWDYLDKKGQEGWELVSVVPEIQGHGATGSSTDGYMLWFKRPVE